MMFFLESGEPSDSLSLLIGTLLVDHRLVSTGHLEAQ